MVAIVLVINSAAYVSEIIRSGIQAVDIGQTEAARSLGLSKTTTMIEVVLPQAIKNILPALGNEFITIIKETSLASTFAVGELMTKYDEIKSVNYNAFPAYIVIGIIYFVLTFSLSKIMKFAERKMKHD
jgi:ABC-type amino acid transport system permease subunit